MTADHDAILEALGNVRFRFWTCPVREHAERNLRNLGTDELVVTVEWRGDIAYCTAPNCEQSSAPDGREAVTERPYTDADVQLIAGELRETGMKDAFFDDSSGSWEVEEKQHQYESAARSVLDALATTGRLLPESTAATVECDTDWTDLRSSRPGAGVQARSYEWPADQFDALLATEIRAAEMFHRAPVRIRKRTVKAYADGSKLVTAWVRVELPADV